MINSCNTCKHWLLYEDEKLWGECWLTRTQNGRSEYYDHVRDGVKIRTIETLARAMDGEEYYAILQTQPSFHCCQWTEKDTE